MRMRPTRVTNRIGGVLLFLPIVIFFFSPLLSYHLIAHDTTHSHICWVCAQAQSAPIGILVSLRLMVTSNCSFVFFFKLSSNSLKSIDFFCFSLFFWIFHLIRLVAHGIGLRKSANTVRDVTIRPKKRSWQRRDCFVECSRKVDRRSCQSNVVALQTSVLGIDSAVMGLCPLIFSSVSMCVRVWKDQPNERRRLCALEHSLIQLVKELK